MFLTLFLFLASAVFIYLSCEIFVNGVEWTGRKLNMSQTATGTLLAAFGTALPESAVTFVAVVLGVTPEQKEIGVGAALGGPLVLATLSYAVVGLVLILSAKKLGRKTDLLETNQTRLSHDQLWFISIFVFKIALGLVSFSGKSWLGVLFLAAYALYVRKEILNQETQSPGEEALEPLTFRPKDNDPSLTWCLMQTLGALTVVGVASHFFVGQLEKLAPLLGLPSQMVALFLSPIATELPETMNAIIWVRQGKEKLALANISGAMMIQATIPSALGIFFTPWRFDQALVVAGIVTLISVLVLYSLFRKSRVNGRTLIPMSLLYLVFISIVAYLK